MRNNIDATIFGGNALTICVLTEIFSSVNQTNKTEIQKMYDFLWIWSKKVHFLWLFMAIKFELSLVVTFMAAYEPCGRFVKSDSHCWSWLLYDDDDVTAVLSEELTHHSILFYLCSFYFLFREVM